MRGQRPAIGLGVLVGALCLSGCVMGDPKGPVFGYRLDHGVVVVAYPICANSEVLSVEVTEYTKSGTYPEVWHAEGPTSEAARHGLFPINSPTDFRTTTPARPGPLPNGVYVGATEPGHDTGARDDYLDLARLRAFRPKAADSYYTSEGPMTRRQIDEQLTCNRE